MDAGTGRLGPLILAEGMGYRYRSGRTGLGPVSFSVGPGEIVTAIGPNGSGKSTLLRLLATDLRPTVGSLSLLSKRVRGSVRRLRPGIGYAPDSPRHFAHLTARESVRFFTGLRGGRDGRGGACVSELFAAFGLEEVGDVPVSELSFGMRRKLLLVETLAFRPPLLLLDEPTVGLDPAGTRALEEAVRERAAAGGAAVIATNDTRAASRWAHRILFLHRGSIAIDAPLAELLDRLDGKTTIEIELVGTLRPDHDRERTGSTWELETVPGAESVRRAVSSDGRGEAIVVQSTRGSTPLPELLTRLLAKGVSITRVRVREPELGDLFHAVTGEPLELSADLPSPERP